MYYVHVLCVDVCIPRIQKTTNRTLSPTTDRYGVALNLKYNYNSPVCSMVSIKVPIISNGPGAQKCKQSRRVG
jgi:hypothetical protein